MPGRRRIRRALMLALLCAAALAAASTTSVVAAGGSTTCRVRNVTQGTRGGSFARMVKASHGGDRLRVRGSCTSRDVVIDHDLVVIGIDDAVLTGRHLDRVVRVGRRATVTIRHLRLAQGLASSGGAAVFNRGRLTLIHVIVQRNFAGNFAGGIANFGDLVMRDSVVRRNRSWYAGGIANGGTVTLIRTRVTRNSGADQGDGGGIINGGR